MRIKFFLSCLAVMAMACSTANADLVITTPTADGTAFELGTTNDFYNATVVNIGGSNNADIEEFISLFYYDISGVTAPAGETFTGDGEVDFGFGDAPGEFSGNIEVDFLGQIAAIPDQTGATNNSPGAIANVVVANSAGTNIATLTGLTEADEVNALFTGIDFAGDDILVFRVTDTNPAPTANQQSAINGFALTLTATAVPEPSSLALFGLGAIAFIARRRR